MMKRKSDRRVKALLPIAFFLLLGGSLGIDWHAHAEGTDIPIDEDHFPDRAFRDFLKNERYLNPDQNDVLSAEELHAVKELNLSSVGIMQFDGLSYFTELETLYCDRNSAGVLDISQNTKLKELDCSNNPIRELDLKGHASLSYLKCDYTYISELDISETNLSLSDWNETGKGFYTASNIDVFAGKVRTMVDTTIFPDAEFFDYVFTNLDTNKSGWLGDNEILAVKMIDVSSQSIQSLSGVELFTELTSLECQQNQLTELSVDKLTKLISLDCSGNQLKELKTDKLSDLKSLYCAENELTSLDVSKNTKLSTLSCGKNQLSKLDVSRNTKLYELSCEWNQLSVLELSKNTELRDLYCGHNLLHKLDLSNHNLKGLGCSGNSISELELGHMTYLRYLDCSVNQIRELNLKNSKLLFWLACNSNRLTSLDISQNVDLSELYAHNSGLEYLVIVKNPNLITIYDSERREKQKYRDGYYYVYNDGNPYGERPELSVDTRTKIVADKIGWKKSGSKWWYLYMDGTYAKDDWIGENGKWYYFGSNGYMVTGWKQINGKWYYFGSTGVMQTGWKKIGGYWYYFSSKGVMQNGWKKLSGKYYYFRDDGTMEVSAYRDGYWLDKNGVCNTKRMATWRKNGSKWWFGDQTGWYAKECWLTIDGREYYFMKNGFLATNQWIGEYYVGSDGAYVGKNYEGDWRKLSASQVPDYKNMLSLLEWYGQYNRYYYSGNATSGDWKDMFFFSDFERKSSPVTAKELKGKDPLGKLPYGSTYYRVSEKDAKWYAKWVLNMTDQQVKQVQKNSDINYYLKDGYYYSWHPGIGGPGYEAVNVSVYTDGVNYYIDYSMHLYNSKSTADDTKMSAVLTRRYGKGKTFWSVYKIDTGE